MGNFYRRSKWNHSAASHSGVAVAAQSIQFDPSLKPDAALIAQRKAKRPNYSDVVSIDPKVDYIVLDVPFGRKGSAEIRQWAKCIGARWNTSHKEWRITASRIDADRLAIINSLRLYLNHTTKAAPQYLARYGNDNCVVFLQIPYEERGTAKSAGARWDSANRCWYFSMKGKTNDQKFSKMISDFEEKGWVDLDRTETYNSKQLSVDPGDSLSQHRLMSKAVVEAMTFIPYAKVKPATAAPSRPSLNIDQKREQQFVNALFSHQNSTDEVMETYVLRSMIGGVETFWRAQKVKGCEFIRWSCRIVGGHVPSERKWVHCYFTADEVRMSWREVVEEKGGEVYTKQGDTFITASTFLVSGNWSASPTVAQIANAKDFLFRIINNQVTISGNALWLA